jgi:hypothetical protein
VAPPEPPLRTCRTCGNVERNFHYRCTNCGRDYAAPPPRLSRRTKLALAIIAGAAVAIGLAIAIPSLLTTKDEHAAKRSASDRAAAVREAARIRLAQHPHAGRLTVPTDDPAAPQDQRLATRRKELVALQAAITRNAQARIAAGRLKGPVRQTLCGPLERVTRGTRQINVGEDADLAVRIGRYDCVAVLRPVVKAGHVVGHLGHDFVGVIDFSTGGYVLCQAYPRQSEAGQALAMAPLPRVCVNAHGERLKGGFLRDRRDTRRPLPLLARAGRA